MPLTNPVLARLADAFGISTEFWDWKGRLTQVDDATVVGILAGMGVDAATEASSSAALADHGLRPWRRALPPCTVMRQGTPAVIGVHVPGGTPAAVWIRLEEGGRREVLMLFPVVFLMLPVTILFAVFPGLTVLAINL